MSLRDEWKDAGKAIGQSFAKTGKSIAKSVKVGVDAAADERPVDENGEPVDTGLKKSWTEVGHQFGAAGKSLGRAAAGTVRKVADAVDEPENNGEEAPKE